MSLSKNNFDKTFDQAKAAMDMLSANSDLPVKDQVHYMAAIVRPLLKAVPKEEMGALIELGVQEGNETLQDLSRLDFIIGSLTANAISREQIKGFLTKNFKQATLEKAVAGTKQTRALITSATFKQHVAINKAFGEALPPRLKAFLEQLSGTEGQSVETTVRKTRAKFKKTDEQIAQQNVEKSQQFPIEAAVDMVHALLTSVRPDKLEKLRDEFVKAVDAGELTILAEKGLEGVQGFVANLEKGGHVFEGFTSVKEAEGFGAALKGVLSKVEDALANAGLLPDATAFLAANKAVQQKLAIK